MADYERRRQVLWQKLNTEKDPADNKPYTDLNYDDFKSKWYGSEINSNTMYDFLVHKRLYPKTKKEFYTTYLCDLTWAKSTSNCVSTPSPPSPPTPSPQVTTYKDCGDGPYAKGCKDKVVGGPISQVQQCLINKGYTLKYGADGKFGKYTEELLYTTTGKKLFNKEEVTSICSKIDSGGSGNSVELPSFVGEVQKKYWQDLKEKGRIYTKGIIYLNKKGTYVYIIKRRKDGTKVPLSSQQELSTQTEESKNALINSFDEFDYEVLYPIDPSVKGKGSVGVLTTKKTNDDEIIITILLDEQGFWEPTEEDEIFTMSPGEDLNEGVIKTILNLRLLEQKVTRYIGSSSNPEKMYYVPKKDVVKTDNKIDGKIDGSSSLTDGNTQEEKSDEVKKSMEPIKNNVLTILDEWDVYNANVKGIIRGSDAAKNEVNTRIDTARDLIKATDSKDFCSANIKNELKLQRQTLITTAEQYKAVITDEDLSYISRLVAEMDKLMTECDRIDKKYENTIIKTDGKTTDDKKSDEVVIKKDDKKSDQTVVSDKEEDKVNSEVKTFLEDNGYTFEQPNIDEKERLSTKTTVGQQLRNLDADGIYEEYYNDKTPIWKSDIESFEDLQYTIKSIESNIPKELKRKYCKSAVKRLFISAFPSTRVLQTKKTSVIEDDNVLNSLKSAIIKCDEQKNFTEGSGGVGDELKSLYRCRSNKKGRSYYGVDRYCLKDYKKLKQDNPTMQMESLVRKHIGKAVHKKTKLNEKTTIVSNILKEIKRLG
jgi:hypothetical protein